MSIASLATRVAAMGREELLFRVQSEARKTLQRARYTLSPPRWNRWALVSILNGARSRDLAAARDSARAGDFVAAHRALGRHFSDRQSCWPLRNSSRASLSQAIRERFPDAPADATVRANALAGGRHDLLGYRNVSCGTPPDWQHDPINDARPPRAFWATIPYLEPAYGDHKVIWELNRHQYWRQLGRAYWLTSDTRYRSAFIAELSSWLAMNPPGQGINWVSMLELAFRCLSWTWSVEFFCGDAERDDDPWLVDLLVGLDRQLDQIAHNLSQYFSPNTHLTGEALALYAVSLAFPELPKSRARADLGRAILLREVERQVRDDGGHAELSGHYHRYSTDFYLLALLVARASADPAADRLESSAREQAQYLRSITDDRGHLPLLGDDDGGQLFGMCGERPADASSTLAAAASALGDPALAVTPASEEVYWILGQAPMFSIAAAAKNEWPSRMLASSGYFVSRTPHGDHLVLDAGAHGFLNSGHSHSDALAVVLTVGSDPVLVDPGTATYTMNPALRDGFRSTRMHNTVVIDGRNHAEPRGPFRWQGAPEGRLLAASIGSGADFAQATHNAYQHATHVRSVLALHDLGWLVVDHVFGSGEVGAESYWHLHPMWTPAVRERCVALRGGNRRLVMAFTAGEVAALSHGLLSMFSPEYGRIESASTLRVTERRQAPFAWGTFVAANPRATESATDDNVDFALVPLAATPDAGWLGTAFEIKMTGVELLILVAASPGAAARGPGRLWGTSTVGTDARLAALRRSNGVWRTLMLVDGERLQVARDGGASSVCANRSPVEAT